jgi:hypothetical protein
MTTGLQANQGYELPGTDPKVVAARAEVRRLEERRDELPNLMREAAMRGDFRAVGDLRGELEQLPLRLWAAQYTEVHADLATNPRERRERLRHRARELAAELVKRPAWPSHRPV